MIRLTIWAPLPSTRPRTSSEVSASEWSRWCPEDQNRRKHVRQCHFLAEKLASSVDKIPYCPGCRVIPWDNGFCKIPCNLSNFYSPMTSSFKSWATKKSITSERRRNSRSEFAIIPLRKTTANKISRDEWLAGYYHRPNEQKNILANSCLAGNQRNFAHPASKTAAWCFSEKNLYLR